jgi:hypothetical protein
LGIGLGLGRPGLSGRYLSGRSSSTLPAATANAGRRSSASATSRRTWGEDWRWLIVIAKLVLLRSTCKCLRLDIPIYRRSRPINTADQSMLPHITFLLAIDLILWYPCVSIICKLQQSKSHFEKLSSSFLPNGCRSIQYFLGAK